MIDDDTSDATSFDFNNDGDGYLSPHEIDAHRKSRIAEYLKTKHEIPHDLFAVLIVFLSLTLICIALCIKALFGHTLEMGDKEVLSTAYIFYFVHFFI